MIERDTEAIKAIVEKVLHTYTEEAKQALAEQLDDLRTDIVLRIDDTTTSDDDTEVVFSITGAVKVGTHKSRPLKERCPSPCCSAPMVVGLEGKDMYTMCTKCLQLVAKVDKVLGHILTIRTIQQLREQLQKDKLELSECCSAPTKVQPAGDSLWVVCTKCEKLITELNPR